MKEAKGLAKDPPAGVVAAPLEDNLFEWHFTLLGVAIHLAGVAMRGTVTRTGTSVISSTFASEAIFGASSV